MDNIQTPSTETPAAVETLEVTWERVLPVWWGFTWRLSGFYLALAAIGLLIEGTGFQTLYYAQLHVFFPSLSPSTSLGSQ